MSEITVHSGKENPTVAVIKMTGSITKGNGATELRNALRQEVNGASDAQILLDLTDVSRIDLDGISEIVLARRYALDRGREFKLIPGNAVGETLQNYHLSQFDIYNDEPTAMRSYKPPAAPLLMGLFK